MESIEAIKRTMIDSEVDWIGKRSAAFLYGIVVGWGPGMLKEVQELHRWGDEVAVLLDRLHREFLLLEAARSIPSSDVEVKAVPGLSMADAIREDAAKKEREACRQIALGVEDKYRLEARQAEVLEMKQMAYKLEAQAATAREIANKIGKGL